MLCGVDGICGKLNCKVGKGVARDADTFFCFIGNFAISYKAKNAPRDAHAFEKEKCRKNATQKRRESFASETLCSDGV